MTEQEELQMLTRMVEDLVPHESSEGITLGVTNAVNGDFIHPERYLANITTLLQIISRIHHIAYQQRGIDQ